MLSPCLGAHRNVNLVSPFPYPSSCPPFVFVQVPTIMSTLCLRPLANLALNHTLNIPQHLLLNTNGFIIVYRKDNRHLPSSELGENGTIMDCCLFRLQVYFTLRRDEFASANFMRVCLHWKYYSIHKRKPGTICHNNVSLNLL